MKGLMFTIYAVLVFLFIFLSLLIYINRDATELWQKFIPAVTLAMVGACFTLWFSLKKHEIEILFPTTFISHKESGNSLELIEPRFSLFYGGKPFNSRGFLKPIEGQEIHDFHFDLALIEISEILYSTFQEFKDQPGSNLYSSNKFPTSLDIKRDSVTWKNYIEYFKCNENLQKQYEAINNGKYSVKNLTLPKGTSVDIECVNNSTRYIILKNKYSEIKISIFKSFGTIGVGEWQWLFDYDMQKNEAFWSSTMNIQMSAKFEKLLSGNPEMPKYINWAEAIFENIQSNLDSKQQIEMAREKHHLYKNQINTFLKKPHSSVLPLTH